ncbi:hypothetical protein HCB17_06680 [Salinispora arenicola]|nr:hypothetical protein [Salinispora arenicola]NIL40891.1 hypothetical protein [Salinispora arenicola]
MTVNWCAGHTLLDFGAVGKLRPNGGSSIEDQVDRITGATGADSVEVR